MPIDGLWTSEIYGLHGWENTGVVVLRDGEAMGGGRNHYSVGTYSLAGDELSLTINITYHGKPRTLFGSSDSTLALHLDGCVDGDVIEGSIHRVENPKQSLSFRLTKRASLA